MSATFKELVEKLHAAQGRIGKILHLGAGIPDAELPDEITEMLEDLDKEGLEQLFGLKMPSDLAEEYEGSGDDFEDTNRVFVDWFLNEEKLHHFVVMAEAKVDWSWGHIYSIYGYGETLEAAVERCILEVEKRRAAQAAKAKKGGAK